MRRPAKPGIYMVGHVVSTPEEIRAWGWGFDLCAPRCPCHRHPVTRQLVLRQDNAAGTLGLVSFRPLPIDPPCGCCEPWTMAELEAVVRDLAEVAALPETSPTA